MKKTLLFLPVLWIASCERPADPDADARREAAESVARAEAAAEERDRLAAETARLEEEKQDLERRLAEERRQREQAEMAVRESEAAAALAEAARREEEAEVRAAELARQERELAARQADTAAREAETANREAEAAAREQELSARELELAGRGALEDRFVEEPEAYRQPVADYDLFYQSLASDGQWFDTPDYGYIFQPTVVVRDRSWRPYTRGRWVCTDRGWLWMSDESFGWATYHYGRWVLLAGRGWCWVPGGEWAPSWVAWRHGGGYVGWAPLPPETLCGRGTAWGASVEIDFGIGDDWFCFVAERHIAEPIVGHCLPSGRNAALRRLGAGCTNGHYRGGMVVVGGPSYADLRRHVGHGWPVCRIENEPLVGLGSSAARHARRDGDLCHVFAPNISAPWNPGLRPARVAESIERVEVVRAPGGVAAQWARKFQEAREAQRQSVRTWADKVKTEREARLAANREQVREAAVAVRPSARPATRPGTTPARPLPEGLTPTQQREQALAEIRERMRSQSKGGVAPQPAPATPVEPVEPERPAVQPSGPQDGGEAARLTLKEKLQRANQEAAEKARAAQERQREAIQRKAAEQAERLRGREDPQRKAAEQAEQARQQEEMQRRAAEQAEQAQQQEEMQRRAAEQAERARQQEEMQRRAAEQAEQARQQQEQQRRAAEQAERARQQEELQRRAAEQAERARQQQEQQRRAAEQAEQARRRAEESARKMQEARERQQERMREAQEKLREKLGRNRGS